MPLPHPVYPKPRDRPRPDRSRHFAGSRGPRSRAVSLARHVETRPDVSGRVHNPSHVKRQYRMVHKLRARTQSRRVRDSNTRIGGTGVLVFGSMNISFRVFRPGERLITAGRGPAISVVVVAYCVVVVVVHTARPYRSSTGLI